MDGRTDGQTLFYRTLPAKARGSIIGPLYLIWNLSQIYPSLGDLNNGQLTEIRDMH